MNKIGSRLLPPAYTWLRNYQRAYWIADLNAASVVTVLLIPQSFAYAMLAGLPPEVGMYASILPLVAYALFGSSRTLSVGPVAIISLLTASALANVAAQGTASYLTAAITLAGLTGVFLLLLGLLKFGFVSNFLSHTVISGFITASAIIIALGQLKHILGIPLAGDNLLDLLPPLWLERHSIHPLTVALGGTMILYLFLVQRYLARGLAALGMSATAAALLARLAPVFGVIISIGLAWGFQLEQQGVQLTGTIPAGLPALSLTIPSWSLLTELAWPAILIGLFGYVESIAVSRALAGKRRQKINPNQELIALGAANCASAISGGFPVTGGFSRSVVNFTAGAVTQAASIMAAIGIALAAVFLTPVLYFLPKAILAATIIVAVVSMIDLAVLQKTWQFAKSDFWPLFITIAVTLLFGVESGVACGVMLSIVLYLYRSARPHIAEVGLIEGTEHFRNCQRFRVITHPDLLMLRPDASLFFANANFLEARIEDLIYRRPAIRQVLLQCSAINEIDFTALEILENLNHKLAEQGITFNLAEIKGPVMDKLKRSGFLTKLNGQIFISQFEAFQQLGRTEKLPLEKI